MGLREYLVRNETLSRSKNPLEPVTRIPEFAFPMMHGNLSDGEPLPGGKHGYETKEVPIDWNRPNRFAPKRLEAAIHVVQAHAAHQPDGSVEDF